MDEIRRRDRNVFLQEFLKPGRSFGNLALLTLAYIGWKEELFIFIPFAAVYIAFWAWRSYNASIPKRFRNQRFLLLWSACKDRKKRFDEALEGLRKKQIADMQDLPVTISSVSKSLYEALRRADNVAHEVYSSEGWLAMIPQSSAPASADRQAQELYRIADKNIAEYRQRLDQIMAAVQRTEAQAAVFTTTLDSLRIRTLAQKLGTEGESLPSGEFLAAMTEARMQLDAIDKALDELELTPFPVTVALMPDSPSLLEPESESNLEERS